MTRKKGKHSRLLLASVKIYRRYGCERTEITREAQPVSSAATNSMLLLLRISFAKKESRPGL